MRALMITVLALTLPVAVSAAGAKHKRSRLPITGECEAVELRPVLAASAAGTAAGRKPERQLTISAARTLAIELSVGARRRVGREKPLEFQLYTPLGHLYQTLDGQIESDQRPGQPAGRASRRVPWRNKATLLVAGTAIVNNSLFGEWTVEPHLRGEARPCGPARDLTILR